MRPHETFNRSTRAGLYLCFRWLINTLRHLLLTFLLWHHKVGQGTFFQPQRHLQKIRVLSCLQVSNLLPYDTLLSRFISNISLRALHLNKHASFVLCDRRLLIKNDQTVSLYHPIPSLPVHNNHVLLTSQKEPFLSSNLGVISLSPFRQERKR